MEEHKQQQIFADWLQDHKGILFKIVRAYAFSPEDQDDLFQEISLQLWQSVPRFRGESKASTWIYRVALFAAMTWARREKNRPQTRPLSEVEHVLTTTGRPGDDRLDWLYAQIALLNPVDRSLCLLLLDGYSYKEMAALLGISESNVGVKIHRIKQHLLRESLEKNHHGV